MTITINSDQRIKRINIEFADTEVISNQEMSEISSTLEESTKALSDAAQSARPGPLML